MTRPTSAGTAGGAAVVSANATAGDSRKAPSLSCAAISASTSRAIAGSEVSPASQRHAVGGRTGQAFVEEGVDPRPLLAGHAPPSSFFSHARATIHDRLTVAGETPSTSAVSSMVRPPK